jgi:cytochrome P450
LLGGAGAETVTKAVGNAAVLFARNPDQWQKVREDRAKIPRAVAEISGSRRHRGSQGRWSHEERTFEGGTIPPGWPVLLLTGATCRDPRAFDEPERFDIDRPANVANYLGHGIHSCVGASLARIGDAPRRRRTGQALEVVGGR